MKPFKEIVTERIGCTVLCSTIANATDEDIAKAAELHKQGKCPHNICTDEYGPIFDIRTCYTCGANLGTV